MPENSIKSKYMATSFSLELLEVGQGVLRLHIPGQRDHGDSSAVYRHDTKGADRAGSSSPRYCLPKSNLTLNNIIILCNFLPALEQLRTQS